MLSLFFTISDSTKSSTSADKLEAALIRLTNQQLSLNRVIEQYLRAFVHRRPGSWGKFLPWAEWSHNTSWNTATGTTPYEITFGRKPFNFSEYIAGSSCIDAVDDMLTACEDTFRAIRKKLPKAQASMKLHADSKRRDVSYEPNDWVLLKLRPLRQTSAKGSQAISGKLAKRFYGPFKIIERIGRVAYRLKLPDETKIHPVFHCSMLNPFRGTPEDEKIATLPAHFTDDQPIIAPAAILDYRQTSATLDSWDVLVQWHGLSPDETSWEDWDQLRQDYHLEDKVILQGPRGDKEAEHTTNTGVQAVTKVQKEHKPKRRIAKPAYLRDYV